MSDTKTLEIYICSTCRPKGAESEATGRPGQDLVNDLAAKLKQQGLEQRFLLKTVECLAVCKRPATISIMSPGKFSYIIGDLDPETAADDLITFAKLYDESSDGVTVWRDRPQQIRLGVISRSPSFAHSHERIKPAINE